MNMSTDIPRMGVKGFIAFIMLGVVVAMCSGCRVSADIHLEGTMGEIIQFAQSIINMVFHLGDFLGNLLNPADPPPPPCSSGIC